MKPTAVRWIEYRCPSCGGLLAMLHEEQPLPDGLTLPCPAPTCAAVLHLHADKKRRRGERGEPPACGLGKVA